MLRMKKSSYGMNNSRAPLFEMWHGSIANLYKNVHSGRLGMVGMLYFGQIHGNKCHLYFFRNICRKPIPKCSIMEACEWRTSRILQLLLLFGGNGS
jgi:hypothetical protein